MGIGVQVNIARQRPAFFDGKMVTCADITQIEDIFLGTPNDKAHSLVNAVDSLLVTLSCWPGPGAAMFRGNHHFFGVKNLSQPRRSYSRELRAPISLPT